MPVGCGRSIHSYRPHSECRPWYSPCRSIRYCRGGGKAVSAYLGHISHPIYLFHLVILYVLARYLPQHNELWHFVPYVTAVVLFTTLFHYGFERPILAARPRYPQVAATGVAPIHDPGKVMRLQQ